MKAHRNLNFRFYATLLDGFQSYLDSEQIYQQYWGNSDNPSRTLEEFKTEQFKGLINRINRVPFDSEPADKGTAFNEVIDCMILNEKSDKIIVSTLLNDDGVVDSLNVIYNERTFNFPIGICRELTAYYQGAIPQVLTEATIETSHGTVLLYGYIDELMPTSIHDIKTTSKYTVGKFRNNWQHKVYPYCLHQNGTPITEFEYNVVVFPKTKAPIEQYTEQYVYRPERDDLSLKRHCEALIEFIQTNKHLITDKKIFNQHQ